jgi:type VI secretion system protein ImpE
MQAKELLDAGNLSAAIAQLNQEVRSHPTDTRQRTFLFELLCFAGDYQRAERQLEVIGQQSATAEIGVQVYRNILAAETARRQLFSAGLRPRFLFDEPPYAHLHLEAVNRLRENRPAEAKALLEDSERTRPHPKGRLAETSFLDLRDADDLIGPFLEVIVHRDYVWLPFEQIKNLHISPPKRLRDLIWNPAKVESRPGAVGEVFLPVLYPGSSEHTDDQVRLGRMTDWMDLGEGLARGVGQRLFLIDGEERALLEIREVEFDEGPNEG